MKRELPTDILLLVMAKVTGFSCIRIPQQKRARITATSSDRSKSKLGTTNGSAINFAAFKYVHTKMSAVKVRTGSEDTRL